MLSPRSSLGFPPPDGVGYIFVSDDAELLGQCLQRYNAMARVGGFSGNPDDPSVLENAALMGREMFRVEDVRLVECSLD